MKKPVPDRDLTEEEKDLVNDLTAEQIKEIDEMLLSFVHPKHSRKVAFLVGSTMCNLPNRVKGIPDVFYSQRVSYLVEQGILASEGDLKYMRFSEVRFP